jgi:uncharacterized protein YqeY
MTAAARAKAALRARLGNALKARDAMTVRVVRRLIAALDDAEAVPVGDRHDRYVLHAFGAAATEMPRRDLDPAEIAAVLGAEHAALAAAAATARAGGQTERAAMLTAEAAVAAEWVAT